MCARGALRYGRGATDAAAVRRGGDATRRPRVPHPWALGTAKKRTDAFKIGMSADVMSDAAQRKARAARFKAEAKAGPPPLPKKNFAHPGGKIATSDKEACLAKLIARKQAAGEDLSEDQRRALATMTNQPATTTAPVHKQQTAATASAQATVAHVPVKSAEPVRTGIAPAPVDIRSAAGKRIKTLRKKLHDIAELEGRQANGGLLQQNQLDKIANKTELVTELEQLEA